MCLCLCECFFFLNSIDGVWFSEWRRAINRSVDPTEDGLNLISLQNDMTNLLIFLVYLFASLFFVTKQICFYTNLWMRKHDFFKISTTSDSFLCNVWIFFLTTKRRDSIFICMVFFLFKEFIFLCVRQIYFIYNYPKKKKTMRMWNVS